MIDILFNNITIEEFIAYYLVALFGLFVSLLLEIVKLNKKLSDFIFLKWFNINKYRILLNLVFIIIGVLFTEDVTGTPLSSFTALLAGFSVDKTIESFQNKK